jgi:hypothetical protein
MSVSSVCFLPAYPWNLNIRFELDKDEGFFRYGLFSYGYGFLEHPVLYVLVKELL